MEIAFSVAMSTRLPRMEMEEGNSKQSGKLYGATPSKSGQILERTRYTVCQGSLEPKSQVYLLWVYEWQKSRKPLDCKRPYDLTRSCNLSYNAYSRLYRL